jgi:hypothetical protein
MSKIRVAGGIRAEFRLPRSGMVESSSGFWLLGGKGEGRKAKARMAATGIPRVIGLAIRSPSPLPSLSPGIAAAASAGFAHSELESRHPQPPAACTSRLLRVTPPTRTGAGETSASIADPRGLATDGWFQMFPATR